METQEGLPQKSDRIYDTFAQVFAGYSECTAVANIGGIIYIAANEVTAKPGEGRRAVLKQQQLIQDSQSLICEFIQSPLQTLENFEPRIREFATRRDTHQGKDKQITIPFCADMEKFTLKQMVFSELVCPFDRQKLVLKQAASLYTSPIHTAAIQYTMQENKALELSLAQKMFGHNEAIGFYACGSTMAQWEHLGKSVNFVSKNPLVNLQSLTWVYDAQNNVHAEMKILNQILEDLQAKKISSGTKIYIGISKDTCFHCHHTLTAAEQVLKEYNIQITVETRGAHDVSFGTTKRVPEPTWQFPKILRAQHLPEMLAKIKEEARNFFKLNDSYMDTSMGATEASSSDEERSEALAHKQYLQALHDTAQKGRGVVPKDADLLTMVEFGLTLHRHRDFIDSFDIEEALDQETAKNNFHFLLKAVFDTPTQEQAKILFQFLKDPRVSGIKIENAFKNLDASVLTQILKTSSQVFLPNAAPSSSPLPDPMPISEDSKELPVMHSASPHPEISPSASSPAPSPNPGTFLPAYNRHTIEKSESAEQLHALDQRSMPESTEAPLKKQRGSADPKI